MIDLDELERLCRGAEPEPWGEKHWYSADGDIEGFSLIANGHLLPMNSYEGTIEEAAANAELIVALRNAAPELIAMARRYEWLRGDRLPEHSVRWMQWEVSCWKAPEWTVDLRHDRLDAAIDAAMQEQKP